MPSRSAFLAKLLGLYLLAFAVYLAGEPKSAVDTLTALMQSPPLVLVCAVLGMTAGLAIVVTHNVWRGGAAPVVITIIGWLALIKGLVLLFMPPALQLPYYAALHFDQFVYGYAALLFVLGGYLTASGFVLNRARP